MAAAQACSGYRSVRPSHDPTVTLQFLVFRSSHGQPRANHKDDPIWLVSLGRWPPRRNPGSGLSLVQLGGFPVDYGAKQWPARQIARWYAGLVRPLRAACETRWWKPQVAVDLVDRAKCFSRLSHGRLQGELTALNYRILSF